MGNLKGAGGATRLSGMESGKGNKKGGGRGGGSTVRADECGSANTHSAVRTSGPDRAHPSAEKPPPGHRSHDPTPTHKIIDLRAHSPVDP